MAVKCNILGTDVVRRDRIACDSFDWQATGEINGGELQEVRHSPQFVSEIHYFCGGGTAIHYHSRSGCSRM